MWWMAIFKRKISEILYGVDKMGEISKHFKRMEFSCKDGCGLNDVSMELIDVLEDIRGYFDSPVTINSGCRCPAHNKAIGGRPHSKHLECIAADISVAGVSPSDVQGYLKNKYPDKYGIGSYNGFTHIDVRKNRARWNG